MCLLARRMVERGVRFVELVFNDWDGHGDCPGNHRGNADKTDQPIAALLADLKQRGLLDSRWCCGRASSAARRSCRATRGATTTPTASAPGWPAAACKAGKAIGATDDLGFRAVDDKVHVHDLHATMLTLLGLDHERLTYLFEGRERRLTDVGGQNNLAAR